MRHLSGQVSADLERETGVGGCNTIQRWQDNLGFQAFRYKNTWAEQKCVSQK